MDRQTLCFSKRKLIKTMSDMRATKYANALLTVIAICVLIQTVALLRGTSSRQVQPVSIEAVNTDTGSLPVSVADGVDVTVTGVAISSRTRLLKHADIQDTLPISIDGINGKALPITHHAIPVEINR